MADLEKIENYITTIEKCLQAIRREVSSGRPQIRVITNQPTSGVSVRMNGKQIIGEERPVEQDRDHDIIVTPSDQSLGFASRVMHDPQWPEAVPEDLLCDSMNEDDLIARSESILDATIDSSLEGLNFLDFGCGAGYTARQAALRGVKKSVGYDIRRDDAWNDHGAIMTDVIDELDRRSFDVILVHDVLDRCERPLEVLRQVYDLLAPGGVVYVRCHPWSSRTGGHLYKQINKAYAHLAVNDDVMRRLGIEVEPIRRVLRPLRTYKELFTQAGFKIRHEDQKTEAIENFFRNNQDAKNAVIRHWDHERNRDPSLTEAKVMDILQIHFIDFVLQAGGGVL